MVQQIVLPIKDSNVLKMVQDTLLDSFRAGRRNYTIFQVGKATLLRVSDVMTLKKSDVYNPDGSVKHTAFIHDKKDWLFPSTAHPDRHITEKQFYKVMARVGDLLGINYLGSHTMRKTGAKTGAYRVYSQSNYNIGLVMHLLNHSSEAMTLTYLGLDQASRENMLDQIDFG
ncbi:tyrosine-type recombinase/integrase [Leuconostoc mesenteroides]|uniref:tyrosine-type recombinase/integrase n=1 Tax=Leuconostoc mesenteroides TaxID=1245 RepID=UPI0022E9802C|nr:tyrosine-type recombinase/integrase [Leuconostoc mesenteroides]